MIRSAPDFDEVYEQSRQEDVESLIDEYYDSLGLEAVDAEWLREAYENAGVIDSEDDYTFVIPRQQPASTIEQISMQQIGQMLGGRLQESGEIDSFSVVGAPLSDKMYGRNSEKRGYAMPAISTGEEIHGTQIADIQDGYSIDSHQIKYRGDAEDIVDEVLGADPEAANLRELHDSLEMPIVQTQGDFTEVQRSMINSMIEHGQEPEVLGVEDSDGKIVGVKYNSETGRYESLDDRRDLSLSKEEASAQGILPPEVNYETIIFPSAIHQDIGYMLRGLENGKFRTENTDELEKQVQQGLQTFPFIDISSEDYHEEVPEERVDELNKTDFGSSSSLKPNGMILNVYPSEKRRKEIAEEDLETEEFRDVTKQILNIAFR